MKFARELEQDLVPEWRAKYLDYKVGKKKIKAIARALRTLNQTPKTPGHHAPISLLAGTAFQSPIRSRNNSNTLQVADQHLGPTPISTPAATPNSGSEQEDQDQSWDHPRDIESGLHSPAKATPITIKGNTPNQGSARDSSTAWDSGAVTNYGSIISSPPANIPPFRPPSLELPDPALPPDEESFARHNRAWRQTSTNPYATPSFRHNSTGHPYEIGTTHTPPKATTSLLHRHRSLFKPKRTASNPAGSTTPDRPRLIRRIFSTTHAESPHIGDVPLAGYKELDTRQAEFDKFLDSELAKIESFYKSKEYEAGERLLVLRQQLHEMRDRRIEEVRSMQRAKAHYKQEEHRLRAEGAEGAGSTLTPDGPALDWRHPINSVLGVGHHVGKNTKALVKMGVGDQGPSSVDVQAQMNRQDFQRRPTHSDEVPYRSAKRKLRLALQEFYRGLELLKSYALVNRTAFRKLNKKYDKAVKARPAGRFMNEKVNKAWFVQSEVLDGQIVAVEDLYARYFERGNHKVAVGKLRSKSNRPSDYNGSVFRNGLLLAAGTVFGIQGLIYGVEHLYDQDTTVSTQASYLLQVCIFTTAVWDLAMDWSLCNPYAEHPFLRDVLGYKKAWYYYAAMILDPILRFNWVFYIIFGNELQHSALLSFMISLSEVGRRAMWTIFRVENEHCTNVGRFRASRDVPLPYDIPRPSPSMVEESRDQFGAHLDGTTSGDLQNTASHMASGAQVAPDLTQPASGSLRRRQGSTPAMPSPMQRGIARVGAIMTQAHAQDFERKRRPGGTPLERQATYEVRQQGKPVEADEGVDSESEDDPNSEGDVESEEARINVDDILSRRRSATG
ncbi:MAG: hypothetical protein Q9186_004675 [Xanthomendoza sp. 1 TL-2023]